MKQTPKEKDIEYGFLDDLIAAAVPLVVAEEAKDFLDSALIDPTGAILAPGRPDLCEGNGEDPRYEICCDNCEHYLTCFPEACTPR